MEASVGEKNSRWDEIRKIHIESATAYRIFGGLVLVGIGVLLGAHFFARDSGYGTNLYTEFISIAVTVFIIDIMNSRRDERRREHELTDRLLREARSPEEEVARHAYHELRERGLTFGDKSILQGVNLRGTTPGRVNLGESNLVLADFYGSHLSESWFHQANLESANLAESNLDKTWFFDARLVNANLQGAFAENAYLIRANLTGANLKYANLDNVVFEAEPAGLEDDLEQAERERNFMRAILPNGEYWTPESDLGQFTDPEHPKFWTSKDPKSPAHPQHNTFRRRWNSRSKVVDGRVAPPQLRLSKRPNDPPL